MPMIKWKIDARKKSIPFRFNSDRKRMSESSQMALIHGKYIFITNLREDGQGDQLFDLVADRSEKNDLVGKNPELVEKLRKEAMDYLISFKKSYEGKDYPDGSGYEMIGEFQEIPVQMEGGKGNKSKSGKKNK